MVTGGTAIYGLLGFFVISASYRAFQMRTGESLVMGVVTILHILGSTTIGEAITPMIPVIGQWIQDVPLTGASVAMMMGLGIGTVAYMLRIITARETRWIGTEEASSGGGE
jgi:hypothetical protein